MTTNVEIRGWMIAAIAAISVAARGCGGKYYSIRTQLSYGEHAEPDPEIVNVRNDTGPTSQVGRIAVQWPSFCANETAAGSSGDAKPDTNLASIDCAVEMSALERAFAKRGYQVVLWDAVRRHALVNETTPEKAAQELGVPMLLRINSLERTVMLPGEGAEWRRQYFHSSKRGGEGRQAVIKDNHADQIDRIATDVEESLGDEGRLAVTVDVTAEHVPTGQVAWFYRWTHVNDEKSELKERFFVKCNENVCRRYRFQTQDTGNQPRSTSARSIANDNEAMQRRATYARLTREALADLVKQFRMASGSGAAGGGSAGGGSSGGDASSNGGDTQ